jgi:hypothetical protein
MAHGIKDSENDRRTFGGSDQTPGLDVEDATGMGGVDIDEMLTCMVE